MTPRGSKFEKFDFLTFFVVVFEDIQDILGYPWDEGLGPGPGTRAQGPGPGIRDQGPGPGPGPGTGTGTRDRDQGPWARDQGPGTRDRDQGQGPFSNFPPSTFPLVACPRSWDLGVNTRDLVVNSMDLGATARLGCKLKGLGCNVGNLKEAYRMQCKPGNLVHA